MKTIAALLTVCSMLAVVGTAAACPWARAKAPADQSAELPPADPKTAGS
ncbi:hypothetical protein [Paroceanicella profunda]|nr:hypothetical protein [Paroceanicella profunda]